MSILLLIFVSFLMSLVQITIFRSMPHSIQKFFAWSVLTALVANFIVSGLIAAFAGAGAIVGIANLTGSVGFGIYLACYKAKHGIHKATIEFRYGIIPTLCIEEKNPITNHWLW